jgi:hypothetical protein
MVATLDAPMDEVQLSLAGSSCTELVEEEIFSAQVPRIWHPHTSTFSPHCFLLFGSACLSS